MRDGGERVDLSYGRFAVVYVEMGERGVTCATLESITWQRHCQAEPSLANGYQSTVHLPAQLIDPHAPVECPHGQSRRGTVEHCAGMQADEDHAHNHQQMCEVEDVKIFPPDDRKGGDEDRQHDQSSHNSGEDE